MYDSLKKGEPPIRILKKIYVISKRCYGELHEESFRNLYNLLAIVVSRKWEITTLNSARNAHSFLKKKRLDDLRFDFSMILGDYFINQNNHKSARIYYNDAMLIDKNRLASKRGNEIIDLLLYSNDANGMPSE